MKKIVFTSGLPRTGSTLLSAILSQNPKFHAPSTSSVCHVFDAIFNIINVPGNNKIVFEKNLYNIFRSIMDSYHEGEGVHFDHNRVWTGRTELIQELYPDFKMIVTVRDICWILDSLERISIKNPHNKPSYAPIRFSSNVYERCETYMEVLIWPVYYALKDLIFKNISNAIIVEYDVLVSDPEKVMRYIYNHIEEPYFQHDFNNIENVEYYDYFGNDVNMPDMHKVKKQIYKEERKIIIPQDIIDKYSGMEIWKNLKS